MKEIIIFTNNGHTYTFKNVSKFGYTTQGIKFIYTGIATGLTREAQFNNESMCGFAICDMEVE